MDRRKALVVTLFLLFLIELATAITTNSQTPPPASAYVTSITVSSNPFVLNTATLPAINQLGSNIRFFQYPNLTGQLYAYEQQLPQTIPTVNSVESTGWKVLPYWQGGQLVINSTRAGAGGYAVTVTVSNSQSIPTPAPFDQFLNITQSQIASALGSTTASQLWQQAVSNRFLNLLFVQNGQKLYAWIQNYTSSWVAVWVKLPNGVPASSSVGITIIFTNSIQYPYTGANPLLTPSYGQYDNGQNVFLFYNNFASPSSLTNFKVINGTNPSLATVTFNNGFNLTVQATSKLNWYLLNSTVSFSEPVMAYVAINVYLFGSTSNPIYLRTAYPMLTDNLTPTVLENQWSDSVAISINGNNNRPWAFFATNASGNAYQYNTGIQGSVSELWGVGYGYSTPVGYFYGKLLSTTYTINYAPRANHPMSLVLGFSGTPTGKFSIKTFYVFVAPLPPNNVMPSITAVTRGEVSVGGQYIAWQYSPVSNTINVTIQVASFPTRTSNSSVAVYSPNVGSQNNDGNTGFYALFVDFYGGSIYFHSPTSSSWVQLYSSLPQPNPNYPFTFTVILTKNGANNVTVSAVYVNSTAYTVNVNTPFPWSQIGYVGIRGDINNVFYVSYFAVNSIPLVSPSGVTSFNFYSPFSLSYTITNTSITVKNTQLAYGVNYLIIPGTNGIIGASFAFYNVTGNVPVLAVSSSPVSVTYNGQTLTLTVVSASQSFVISPLGTPAQNYQSLTGGVVILPQSGKATFYAKYQPNLVSTFSTVSSSSSSSGITTVINLNQTLPPPTTTPITTTPAPTINPNQVSVVINGSVYLMAPWLVHYSIPSVNSSVTAYLIYNYSINRPVLMLSSPTNVNVSVTFTASNGTVLLSKSVVSPTTVTLPVATGNITVKTTNSTITIPLTYQRFNVVSLTNAIMNAPILGAIAVLTLFFVSFFIGFVFRTVPNAMALGAVVYITAVAPFLIAIGFPMSVVLLTVALAVVALIYSIWALRVTDVGR